jgi:hypothetical protein
MTEGLLYQRSVTPISKQRSSGHIGDVAQLLAQTFTVGFTTLLLYHPGKCLGILAERGLCGYQRLSEGGNMS